MSSAATASRKLSMTNWYSPAILVKTAIRVAVSTVFGEFADRRESIAASNAIEPQPFDESFDYSAEGSDFWFDYLADTGDGWNPTYAMARLVSANSLRVAEEPPLPRGKFLMLGGDQVYPFASRDAYSERFLAPFNRAWQEHGQPLWKEGDHDLYAVPGNHDWYDGLNAFFGLFCRRRIKPNVGIGSSRPGRMIAGRNTNQTRSYFALQLPHKWWLWATDSQLEGYIDQPQIEYFQHAARYWMKPGSNVILCVDGPRWAYADEKDPSAVFENFSYLERLAGAATGEDGKPMGHELRLVLTGDSHHYSRYLEGDRHYVTCGGGGAFLHPTHHLVDKDFDWKFPPPGQAPDGSKAYRRQFRIAKSDDGQEALYPSREQSRELAFLNLAFAWKNKAFTITLFAIYAVFHWLLHLNALAVLGQSLGDALWIDGLAGAIETYWLLVFGSPTAILLILMGLGAYYYAAAAPPFWRKALMGGGHALAQAIVVTLTICTVMRLLPAIGALPEVLIAAAAAAVLSATTYGLYLLICVLTTKYHWNEGFSSFAHPGFKCMLRMSISQKGTLTIFPIGLESVPDSTRNPVEEPALAPHLIEVPISIG